MVLTPKFRNNLEGWKRRRLDIDYPTFQPSRLPPLIIKTHQRLANAALTMINTPASAGPGLYPFQGCR